MKKKKTAKRGGQLSRRGNYSQQQQQQSLHQVVKERIFQVRRQAQYLTRAVEIRAASYDALKAESARAFGIEDTDSFTLRELVTSDRDERDIQSVGFSQISSDLLLTFRDELPLMPGLHSN